MTKGKVMQKTFQTKDGGQVAMADNGVARMGCNPFGFGCPDCGASFSFRYEVLREEGGELFKLENVEDYYLDLEVKRDELETKRLREHLGVEDVDVDLDLAAVSEILDSALAVVLENGEIAPKLLDKAQQLVAVLGEHRQVLANFRATLQHIVQGIEIARDAVQQELETQRLISIVGQSHYLLMAYDALSTMVPVEKKEEASKLILMGSAART